MFNVLFGFLAGWRPFTGQVTGTLVHGDFKAPPTRWWNHWWLASMGWNSIAVLEVSTRSPFRIGYRDQWGTAKVKTEILLPSPTGRSRFAMQIGHEDCTFFAVEADTGKEIPLRLLARKDRDAHDEDSDGPLF